MNPHHATGWLLLIAAIAIAALAPKPLPGGAALLACLLGLSSIYFLTRGRA